MKYIIACHKQLQKINSGRSRLQLRERQAEICLGRADKAILQEAFIKMLR